MAAFDATFASVGEATRWTAAVSVAVAFEVCPGVDDWPTPRASTAATGTATTIAITAIAAFVRRLIRSASKSWPSWITE